MKNIKKAYKILELDCNDGDKEHYFSAKELALRFLADEIERREYVGDKHGCPQRDVYNKKKDDGIHSMVINQKWEKVAPYFQLYLSEISIITEYRRDL